jgi:hypothetical protein
MPCGIVPYQGIPQRHISRILAGNEFLAASTALNFDQPCLHHLVGQGIGIVDNRKRRRFPCLVDPNE